MATAQTYTKSGNKAASTTKLDVSVFGCKPTNHTLLRQAYETNLANSRPNLAVVKTRGLVRGGGKKPWKQKGTGRARFGSSRNPIWRGGGIVFGPTGEENYTKRLNTKAKRLALRQALSIAAEAGKVIVVESVESKEGKTSEAAKLLAKVGATGKVLIVVSHKEKALSRAVSNQSKVSVTQVNYLNVRDILNADNLVIDKPSLDFLKNWLGGKV